MTERMANNSYIEENDPYGLLNKGSEQTTINGEKIPVDPMQDMPKVGSKFIKSTTPINNTFNPTPQNPARPMTFIAKDKSIEEKTYIILYKINGNEDDDIFSKIFEVCIGRTAAYSDIKNKLQSGLDIDVHRSYIMTETKQTETATGDIKYYMIPYDECISVYSFCISVADFFNNDEFDIEDYADGDIPEDNRMNDTAHFLSADQIQYRNMLEESLKRDKFICDLRKQIESNNI